MIAVPVRHCYVSAGLLIWPDHRAACCNLRPPTATYVGLYPGLLLLYGVAPEALLAGLAGEPLDDEGLPLGLAGVHDDDDDDDDDDELLLLLLDGDEPPLEEGLPATTFIQHACRRDNASSLVLQQTPQMAILCIYWKHFKRCRGLLHPCPSMSDIPGNMKNTGLTHEIHSNQADLSKRLPCGDVEEGDDEDEEGDDDFVNAEVPDIVYELDDKLLFEVELLPKAREVGLHSKCSWVAETDWQAAFELLQTASGQAPGMQGFVGWPLSLGWHTPAIEPPKYISTAPPIGDNASSNTIHVAGGILVTTSTHQA